MKAITVKKAGGPEQLQLSEVPIPKPGTGEILIQTKAAAINRTDILGRQGKVAYLPSDILGVEVAGVVVDSNQSDFAEGDFVMGLVNGGGYAEYVVMPAQRAMKIPASLTFAEAAAIPEVFLTAYQTLFWIGQLKRKETVLIHAAASGVGTAAIQLAKQLTDATVIVTAGSDSKLEVARQLGADVLINYKEEDFDQQVLQATKGQGVDLILDFIGASYWQKNLNSIKTGGRWVLIGILGGQFVEQVDLFQLMSKCIQLTGTLLTPRSDQYKAELTHDFIQHVFPYFENHRIKPLIDTKFSLAEVATAHSRMEDNRNIGKIILTVAD
ncbi:NAD(P)H-quinone oxidoreductase [Enterococcus asini]|uniref:NAD(P)H-quinone oxidoreductase n=1 Tax=Enterococcus asini TaxID=57732 RepID=A0AAW8U198_9ENTE|nr:NAD(P)H-quinone oxidoreductase [Enterococcus asini]MDT2809695.1 NAD(P)H-quinone oxidoreductase [Enterococcus asini]